MRKIHQEDYGKLWDLNHVWACLTPDEKEFIDQYTEIKRYRKGEIIHSEGDQTTHIVMVVQGTVRLTKEGVGQRLQIIRLLKPYDTFGYRSAIAGDSHSTCATTLEATLTYRVAREAFLYVIQRNITFCYKVLVAMSKDLAISESQTVNLTQKHIRGRLAETLITLKKTYGLDGDGVTIAMYMAREDLANMSNMTTSNAIRTLSQFASEGLISLDGRKIKLLDENELTRISRMG
ncbi:MAG: Crp/Fnr family transcriptional regulator [Paludibacteraceae bacterium]|nr:Crp/Fnr family transcriptional regulator [Paludibacteraceae bacterium]